MNNNKGVKYGDPIKVDVSATLTWGKPAAKPVSGVPTSQMTQDQINTAYATGSDTGASHEAVKVEKINNFNNSLAKGVDVGSLISLENAGVTFYNFNGQRMICLTFYSKPALITSVCGFGTIHTMPRCRPTVVVSATRPT